ncbi:hypothetical protein [Xylanimonas protaetiae]|uniref:Type IV toxin-antitoxin system AbiEi family antitoxin domain-containing protein n=1 Tax=Xylanimonas protaetiae TaxID=2509457 RepID=A0A4P6F1W4_9MICO|nr:hypothetical protein [Xylanimonas protaetiae]QAY69135.1 hypothetical protein ET471_02990 [Xylanimonas protaetiae]
MSRSAEVMIAREHNRDALRRDLAAGVLLRTRRGAYVRAADLDAREKEIARIRSVSRQLAAPHTVGFASAAVVYGAPLWQPPGRVHVYVASSGSSRSAKDVARHVTDVPPEQAVVRALPVTTVMRTVVDCALTMHPLESLVIADWAVGRRGLDREEALELVRARRRPNGKATAELVLRMAAAGVRSPRETWLRYLTQREGLPVPVVEPPIATRLGVFHCDLGWPEHGVYAEFDGLVKYRDDGVRPGHSGAKELIEEKRRFDAIRETGANPIRVTVKDDPRQAMARLKSAFPPELRATFRPHPRLPWPP